jgi:hypothetical protein
MFRKGGSANEGIMHGLVDRKGYANGTPGMEDVRSYMNLIKGFAGPAPDPVPELLVTGGLNVLSGQHAGGGTLANIAGSFKKPTETFFAAKRAERAQDTALAMQAYENLSKDEKIMMEKRAQLLVDQGLAKNLAEALRMELYRKTEDPGMARTRRIEERTGEYTKGTFPDSHAIATAKATFDIDRPTITANNPDLDFDPIDPFIDVEGKRTSYRAGAIYFNPADGTYMRFDGPSVETDWTDISEIIK